METRKDLKISTCGFSGLLEEADPGVCTSCLKEFEFPEFGIVILPPLNGGSSFSRIVLAEEYVESHRPLGIFSSLRANEREGGPALFGGCMVE